MRRYRAWSDGSRVHNGVAAVGAGGWACVVERGSEGWVLRGRVPLVTSTRMELFGALEALRSIPRGHGVDMHVDCTVLLSVHDAWTFSRAQGSWRPRRQRGADADLWHALFVQFDELDVSVVLLGKGHRDLVHNRCHHIANAEARALHRSAPPPSLERKELRDRRQSMSGKAASGWQAFDTP